ncbi:hypothetical protein [Tunturiibacter gelidoferens]|uniref:Uncharacterized protein n=1 Tax=Tunturiibacter gelidiferens TaxID=3069689 RepID=A0ACC5P1J7_9BACT|nr:hypothetical protein [Edaphobacter lichenicola]MBB5340726.1 hypothetical protein [Edaphobacter lichenicola]
MTQPPYPPSDDRSTRRLAIFVAVLLVIVAIGSQPGRATGAGTNKSLNSMCVCVPSRAALFLKSAVARTQARSSARLTYTAAVTQ